MDWKTAGEKVRVGGEFYRLENGANKFRIVSGVEERGTHFVQSMKKSFNCVGKEDGCDYCIAGDKPRVKFMMYVIDRRDGKVKLAEFGYSIFKAIVKLQRDEDYSFETFPDYDLKVTKTGEGMNTEYTVTPSPNRSPLTPEELAELSSKTPLNEVAEKLRTKKTEDKEVARIADEVPFE